mgnify:CR=1 FL=1
MKAQREFWVLTKGILTCPIFRASCKLQGQLRTNQNWIITFHVWQRQLNPILFVSTLISYQLPLLLSSLLLQHHLPIHIAVITCREWQDQRVRCLGFKRLWFEEPFKGSRIWYLHLICNVLVFSLRQYLNKQEISCSCLSFLESQNLVWLFLVQCTCHIILLKPDIQQYLNAQ